MSNAQNNDPVDDGLANENPPGYSDDGVNPVGDPVPGYRYQSPPPEYQAVDRLDRPASKECATPDDVKEEIRRAFQAIYNMIVEEAAGRDPYMIAERMAQLKQLERGLPYIGRLIINFPPRHRREMAELFTHIIHQAAKERNQFFSAAIDNLVPHLTHNMITTVQEALVYQSHIKLAECARRLGGPNLVEYLKGPYAEWSIRYAIRISRVWMMRFEGEKREVAYSRGCVQPTFTLSSITHGRWRRFTRVVGRLQRRFHVCLRETA